MAFRQVAEGYFVIDVHGLNHCGPNHDSPKRFKYEVEVVAPDSALSAQGFLLDNLEFDHYFNTLESTELSCEALARQCALHFTNLINYERIAVGIYGIFGSERSAKVEYVVDRRTSGVAL